jgi:hypothetical protein
VLSATADTKPTQRDGHIQAIAGKGRMVWQRDSGYKERGSSFFYVHVSWLNEWIRPAVSWD